MKSLLILITAGVLQLPAQAQEWVVPDDQKAVVAPFMFTPEMQKQGELSYQKNCQSCHGQMGKDNWVKLVPPPGDLAKDKAQKLTDGAIFYKITAGKAPMPEFRNIIPEEERWHLVAYIRSFNPAYVQPAPAAAKAFAGRTVSLAMAYDSLQKKLVVTAAEKLKDGGDGPAEGIQVVLQVKRYFGSLNIGDPKTTNAQGKAVFDFPSDLPGDRDGLVELTATVNDPRSEMRTTPAKAALALGTPMTRPGLTETRAWWSTRDKAPVWIALTYTLAVVIVWGFIFYILYTILQLRKLGN